MFNPQRRVTGNLDEETLGKVRKAGPGEAAVLSPDTDHRTRHEEDATASVLIDGLDNRNEELREINARLRCITEAIVGSRPENEAADGRGGPVGDGVMNAAYIRIAAMSDPIDSIRRQLSRLEGVLS